MPPGKHIRVLFTARRGAHATYAEMAEAPPSNVTFSWPPGKGWTSANAAWGGTARGLFQLLRLPNVAAAPHVGGDVDVIHSCQRLLLTRRPWVVDIEHGQPFVGTRFERLESGLTRKGILTVLGFDSCRAILPWSQTACQAFIDTLRPPERIRRKIRVIYPAVRAPQEISQNEDSRRCRLLLVANKPEYNVLLKGGRELVQAFDLVRQRGLRGSLIIVGPTPASFTALCRTVPGVILTGSLNREQLDQMYRRADVYVMPTFSDTFGMVFLEAMAHGLPIVALDRPYTREIVRQGESGLLVEMPHSAVHWCDQHGRFTMDSDTFIGRVLVTPPSELLVRSLATTLARLIEDVDLRRRLGRAGREEVLAGRFSVARRNTALGEIYSEAIAERG